MSDHPLKNPVWSALTTDHAAFARTYRGLKRYPSQVAPFCAVAEDGVSIEDASSIPMGSSVYFIGAIPELPPAWNLEQQAMLWQMVYPGGIEQIRATLVSEDSEGVDLLSERDVPEMMELIAVAFPGFFRSGTINMGKYLGIRQQGALVAMAGERLSISGYREISGVCTHPDHTGRGYARRLISILIHDILTRGLTPFLHFVSGNERASLLYKKLGFTVHSEIAMARVRRQF